MEMEAKFTVLREILELIADEFMFYLYLALFIICM